MYHVHLRIHRWVIWWFYFGVVCGLVALVNILGRTLTRTQEHILLIVGISHWILGGFICWAAEGVQVHSVQQHDKPSLTSEGRKHTLDRSSEPVMGRNTREILVKR